LERCFLEEGGLIRPFCRSADVKCRGYSQPLQRRITDFGSDVPFGKISFKLKEHYGIEVPTSSAQAITEAHARRIREDECLETEIAERPGVDRIVAELDGSMIPIVRTDSIPCGDEPTDRRKRRQVGWKEARLSLARPLGSVEAVYETMFLGDVDDAGDRMAHCVVKAGAGENSKIHCVGDGAAWIADQTERVFGLQADFLVDFYHLCDYLAAAAESISPEGKKVWLSEQKKNLKEGKISEVIGTIEPYVEPVSVPKDKAPVRTCYGYMTNRKGQFNYKEALAEGLPIGSGEVESAHRYVIQDRLKLAGAWGSPQNAHNMLALRSLRANNRWDSYWNHMN
jgi:hypothetical protein